MKEGDNMLRRKKEEYECLEGKEPMYVRSTMEKVEQYGFYLRFIQRHFIPCSECQIKLDKLIKNASHMNLGNKNYDPPVELWKKYEIDDNSWKEIERRPATKEEIEILKDTWIE